jgi:menaquinone-specific isochorismate synthase
MPVTPYCNNLFQSRRDLYQFLSACKEKIVTSKDSCIISISLEIDPVDPLVIYHRFAQSQQLNFYVEKRESNKISDLNGNGHSRAQFHSGLVGIAAIDSVISAHLEGSDRFELAKQFVQSTLNQTVILGALNHPLAGPHFFCGFSFFDSSSEAQKSFSAATIFLPKWQISYQENCSILVINLLINSELDLASTIDDIWQTVEAIRSTRYNLISPEIHNQDFLTIRHVNDTGHFKQAVRSALQSIRSGFLDKIVLAHAVDIDSPLPFQPVYSLHNLRRLYPDCYIFAVSNGRGQYFLGASPERLVSLRDRHLITDALAGSAPRGKTTCEDAHLANSLLNSAKEMHEHRVVLEFITRQLQQLGLSPQPFPLRLRQLSNIQHLQTPIQALVPAHIHLLDAIAELHPTPAVAGVPRDVACALIRQYEGFERSLYAAPIGWVDYQGNGEFAVGIRSALIDGCHARLFAGAGIVSGSDPNRELAEVQLKLQALLAALV